MKTLLIFLVLALTPALHSCSGKKVDENDPKSMYDDAEEEFRDKRFQAAVEKFKVVKNKFPYSNYSKLAALRIADVYFQEESYIEAAGAYETFRDLHPKSEKADYVLYQIGESYYNQYPGSIDRDLTPGSKAITAYRELLSLYPSSSYAEKAKSHLDESAEKLSEKERYVADFYFKRDMYDSAAKRYEKITSQFPGTKVEEYAYWRWGQSLYRQGSNPELSDKKGALIDETRHVFRVYLSRFPNGTYVKKVNSWLEKPEALQDEDLP